MLWLKTKRVGRFLAYCGIAKGFAIGFSVDRYHVMIDLGVFWFGAEW